MAIITEEVPVKGKYQLQELLSCFGSKLHIQFCYNKLILRHIVSD